MQEPEASLNYFNSAPKAFLNLADLPATGLEQPGSRITYRLVVAGEPVAVEQFVASARRGLGRGQRLETAADARPEIRSAMDRAGRFLGLAALVSVVLAAIAVAMAARRHSARHLAGSAVMRCLGASQRTLVGIHVGELLMLGVFASAARRAAGAVAAVGGRRLAGRSTESRHSGGGMATGARRNGRRPDGAARIRRAAGAGPAARAGAARAAPGSGYRRTQRLDRDVRRPGGPGPAAVVEGGLGRARYRDAGRDQRHAGGPGRARLWADRAGPAPPWRAHADPGAMDWPMSAVGRQPASRRFHRWAWG